MEPKKIAEIRKFLSTISDPKIRPIIDLDKFVNTGLYTSTMKMALDHALAHGDFGYLNQLFSVVDGSQHVSGFIGALRPKIGFIITETQPRKLKKATAEQVEKAAKIAASKPVATKKVPAKKSTKTGRPHVPAKDKDLLDSWLMLPGSYGAGKRR